MSKVLETRKSSQALAVRKEIEITHIISLLYVSIIITFNLSL
jgi:hypothetical protein